MDDKKINGQAPATLGGLDEEGLRAVLGLLGADTQAVVRLAGDGRIVSLTPAAESALALKPGEALGLRLSDSNSELLKESLERREPVLFADHLGARRLYDFKSAPSGEGALVLLTPREQQTLLDAVSYTHLEHGGGNNSTFTTHVVTSSGTDTYSAMAAALGSLKGPKHGGANIKVVQMFEDLRKNVADTTDEDAVRAYLLRLLRREAFDQKGLIYGMGHAVYSLSDPRARIFKNFVAALAEEKGRTDDYKLYEMVERLAPKVIADERKIYKGVSANVDFYSGFVYSMLGLPLELYTPMFAIARVVGWSAHRMEELINADKIIRPAYQSVVEPMPYRPMGER